MGLDGVELLMALEEAFGVEIENGEAAKTVTPGMVIDLIYSKLRHADQKVCPSQRAFYILRKACVRLFHANRKTFSLDTPIRSLIDREREAADWARLQQAAESRRWPGLGRPRWLVGLLSVLTFGILVGFLFLRGAFGILCPMLLLPIRSNGHASRWRSW